MTIDFTAAKNRTKKGACIKRLEENLKNAQDNLDEILNPTDLRVRNGYSEGGDIIEAINNLKDAKNALLQERTEGRAEDFDKDLEEMRKLKNGEITEDELMDSAFGKGASEYYHKAMAEGWELDED